jgi:hypothetical protein
VTLGSTIGYAHAYRFWADSGKSSLWYPTDGTWIDAGDKLGANLSEITADVAQRDSLTVHLEARVAPLNERYERGSWVVSSGTAPVYPANEQTPGSAASVALAIGAGTDSSSYMATGTLTPPSPLGPAVAWEAWIKLYYLVGDVSPYLVNQVHDWIDISRTVESFGPYQRGVDYEPYAELWVRLIYSHEAKSDWIVSPRVKVGKQVAPPATITNLSSIRTPDDFRTYNGAPEYRVHQKVTLSGSKEACDWIETIVEFYLDSGMVTQDGYTYPGGLDPMLLDTWPITVEADTPWQPRPTYDFWYRVGARAINAAKVPGAWVWTTLTKVNKSDGFDASGINTSTLGDTFLVSGGKLTNYALTYLSKWGLSSADFEESLGNVIIKTAVMDRLLARSATITSDLTITRSGSGGAVTIDGSGVTISKTSGASMALTATTLFLDFNTADVTLSEDGISCNKGSFAGAVDGKSIKADGTTFADRYSSSGILLSAYAVTCGERFTHSGSTVSLTSPSAWRTALNVSEKVTVTGATVPLAKITSGGTDGSLTFNADGKITAYTAPT